MAKKIKQSKQPKSDSAPIQKPAPEQPSLSATVQMKVENDKKIKKQMK
jgi:hypothetical protein